MLYVITRSLMCAGSGEYEVAARTSGIAQNSATDAINSSGLRMMFFTGESASGILTCALAINRMTKQSCYSIKILVKRRSRAYLKSSERQGTPKALANSSPGFLSLGLRRTKLSNAEGLGERCGW